MIAAWDLVRATEIEAFRLPEPAPSWHHRFLPAPARGSVIFQHDVGFDRADVVELSLTTWQVRTIARDVREVLDVSADGRFVVAAAFANPDAATRTVFEQQLVLIDVELGREVARLALPARLAKLYDARFVSPPP